MLWCYEKKEKRENGYSYKEANPFLTTYPLTPRVFIYLFLFFMRRGSGWKFWERFPKEKLERERERKENFLPYRNCGGQLYPVLKSRWKMPGPISDLICTSCVRRGQAQRLIWGWENIWGQSTKEEIRFASEERWRTLVGI